MERKVELRGYSCPRFNHQHKLGVVAYACDPRTLEWKARGLKVVRGHPWLHSWFEPRLGYIRPCLKQGRGRGDGSVGRVPTV